MQKKLTMTTAMAASIAALSGCSSNDRVDNQYASNDTAVCTDWDGERVDDDQCDDHSYQTGSGARHSWFYIRRGSPLPFYGDSVRDPRFAGSYTADTGRGYYRAPAASRMTRSQAVSRGGLGSSSRAFGGGRS